MLTRLNSSQIGNLVVVDAIRFVSFLLPSLVTATVCHLKPSSYDVATHIDAVFFIGHLCYNSLSRILANFIALYLSQMSLNA